MCIAAVVLGGLAPTLPQDDANKTGSGKQKEKNTNKREMNEWEKKTNENEMEQISKKFFLFFHFCEHAQFGCFQFTAAHASGEEEVNMIWRRTPCPSGAGAEAW
jgi:hypothetical protein